MPSSSPRTSASTRTPASTMSASSAPRCATCARADSRRASRTITMQLARNVFPDRISREKTHRSASSRKRRSRARSRRYPKDKILELYLNQIYLGNGAYGVETASQRYFGKRCRSSTSPKRRCSRRCPRRPERYNPRRYRRSRDPAPQHGARADAPRRARSATPMPSLAKAYPLQLAQRTESGETRAVLRGVGAPAARGAVRQPAVREGTQGLHDARPRHAGAPPSARSRTSSSDRGRQVRAVHAPDVRAVPGAQRPKAARRHGANSPYLQGAFVAVDPRTGAVRALVGGRDFDDSKFNRAVQALRQPGSTFKPIVYAAAVRAGLGPARCDRRFADQHGPGERRGMDAAELRPEVRRARCRCVARSIMSRNIAAIRVGMDLGPQQVISMARRFGITHADPAVSVASTSARPTSIRSR